MDRCCSSGRASQRRMVRQGLSTSQSVVVRERWRGAEMNDTYQCSVVRVDYILLGHRCGAVRHRFKHLQQVKHITRKN